MLLLTTWWPGSRLKSWHLFCHQQGTQAQCYFGARFIPFSCFSHVSILLHGWWTHCSKLCPWGSKPLGIPPRTVRTKWISPSEMKIQWTSSSQSLSHGSYRSPATTKTSRHWQICQIAGNSCEHWPWFVLLSLPKCLMGCSGSHQQSYISR